MESRILICSYFIGLNVAMTTGIPFINFLKINDSLKDGLSGRPNPVTSQSILKATPLLRLLPSLHKSQSVESTYKTLADVEHKSTWNTISTSLDKENYSSENGTIISSKIIDLHTTKATEIPTVLGNKKLCNTYISLDNPSSRNDGEVESSRTENMHSLDLPISSSINTTLNHLNITKILKNRRVTIDLTESKTNDVTFTPVEFTRSTTTRMTTLTKLSSSTSNKNNIMFSSIFGSTIEFSRSVASHHSSKINPSKQIEASTKLPYPSLTTSYSQLEILYAPKISFNYELSGSSESYDSSVSARGDMKSNVKKTGTSISSQDVTNDFSYIIDNDLKSKQLRTSSTRIITMTPSPTQMVSRYVFHGLFSNQKNNKLTNEESIHNKNLTTSSKALPAVSIEDSSFASKYNHSTNYLPHIKSFQSTPSLKDIPTQIQYKQHKQHTAIDIEKRSYHVSPLSTDGLMLSNFSIDYTFSSSTQGPIFKSGDVSQVTLHVDSSSPSLVNNRKASKSFFQSYTQLRKTINYSIPTNIQQQTLSLITLSLGNSVIIHNTQQTASTQISIDTLSLHPGKSTPESTGSTSINSVITAFVDSGDKEDIIELGSAEYSSGESGMISSGASTTDVDQESGDISSGSINEYIELSGASASGGISIDTESGDVESKSVQQETEKIYLKLKALTADRKLENERILSNEKRVTENGKAVSVGEPIEGIDQLKSDEGIDGAMEEKIYLEIDYLGSCELCQGEKPSQDEIKKMAYLNAMQMFDFAILVAKDKSQKHILLMTILKDHLKKIDPYTEVVRVNSRKCDCEEKVTEGSYILAGSYFGDKIYLNALLPFYKVNNYEDTKLILAELGITKEKA